MCTEGAELETLFAARDNLLAPPLLFFVIGIVAARTRSDLTFPEAIAQGLSIYLLAAIGLKGGWQLRDAGFTPQIAIQVVAAVALGLALALIAYGLLNRLTPLARADRAALAAHYGSVSVVTFVTAADFLERQGLTYEGQLVAMMALMEAPAIVVAIWLARRHSEAPNEISHLFTSGSVIVLLGALIAGLLSGDSGREQTGAFFLDPFRGLLALFLLEMGLKAGARLGEFRAAGPNVVAFAIYMPLIGAVLGALTGAAVGLGTGGTALLAVLAASASYIAAPAAVRQSIPEANPVLYATLPLALTFPFNITIGIPLYYELARLLT